MVENAARRRLGARTEPSRGRRVQNAVVALGAVLAMVLAAAPGGAVQRPVTPEPPVTSEAAPAGAVPDGATLRAAADAGVSVLGGVDDCASPGPVSRFRHSPHCDGAAAAADPAAPTTPAPPSSARPAGAPLLCAPEAATGERCPVWETYYDHPGSHVHNGSEWTTDLGTDPSGALVYLTGLSSDEQDDVDGATVAVDATTGETRWVTRFSAGTRKREGFQALATSADGSRVYAAGWQYWSPAAQTPSNYAAVAYDAASGKELWRASYNGTGGYHDDAFDVAVSPDGTRVFLTGVSAGRGTDWDYATVAFDAATGERLWARRYDNGRKGPDWARFVQVSRDGSRVFVFGQSQGEGTEKGFIDYDLDTVMVAYDAATGGQLWESRFEGGAHDADFDQAMEVSPDGSLVYAAIGARCCGKGKSQFHEHAVVAYDSATGEERWEQRYGDRGTTRALPWAMAVDPDGRRVYVAGDNARKYATVAYDAATGERQWEQRFSAGTNNRALAVAVDGSTGRVYVTGWTASPYSLETGTVAYDAVAGEQRWAATRNRSPAADERLSPGVYYEIGMGVAVAPDGGAVYVATQLYDALVRADRNLTQRCFPGEPCNHSDFGLFAYATDDPAATCRRSLGDESGPPRFRSCVQPSVTATASDAGADPSAPPGETGSSACSTTPVVDDRCEEWVATQAAADESAWQVPTAMAVDGAGDALYVVGRTSTTPFVTTAFDQDTGAHRWTATYRGDFVNADAPYAVAVSPDGRHVYVTGVHNYDGDNVDASVVTIAYDAATGEQEWLRSWGASGYDTIDMGEAIAVSGDGRRVYVAAGSRNPDGGELYDDVDWATLAYDTASGELLWAERYAAPGGRFDLPAAAVETAGTLYVAGVSRPEPDGEFAATIVAYDATTGVRRWAGDQERTWYPAGFAVTPDGSRAIIATHQWDDSAEWPLNASYDLLTVAYDTTDGSEAWARRYSAAPALFVEYSAGLALDPAGRRVFVTGRTYPFVALMQIATVAYEVATGEELWAARYAHLAWQEPTGIVTSPDGRLVYAVGYSNDGLQHSGGTSVVTLAYDAASGDRRWTARYRKPGNTHNVPYATAVSPATGRVYNAVRAYPTAVHRVVGTTANVVAYAGGG